MEGLKENYNIKLFVQSSHYFIGTVIVMMGGFISLPILTRVFSRSEYGILSLVSVTLWIALAFSKAGMQESAVRFYGDFNDGKRHETLAVFYSTLLMSALLLALTVAALLWFLVHVLSINLFGSLNERLTLIIMVLVVTGTLLSSINSFFRAAQNTKVFNLINILQRYLGMAFGISFLLLVYNSVTWYYYGIILAEIVILLIFAGILFGKGHVKITSYSWTFFKECWLFGFPLIFMALASYLLKATDRYLIQMLLGTESVGIYSLGSDLCLYIKDTMVNPLFFAIVPIYMELWNNKGAERTKAFLSKTLEYYSLITIPVLFGFIALAKEIVIIVASVKFVDSATVIPLILPGALFYGYYPIVSAGLYIHKQTKRISMLMLLGVVCNIVLNLILIPRMQLRGAALATLITYVIFMCVLIKISFRYLKFHLHVGSLAKIAFASIVMYFAVKNISIGTGAVALLLHILLGIAVYFVLMIVMEKKYRLFIRSILMRRFSA